MRIHTLDLLRFFCVTGALFSHSISHFNVQNYVVPELIFWIRVITRFATPSLLILFGLIIGFVYAPKFNRSRLDVRYRMYFRSFQCYLAFVFLSTLGFTFGGFKNVEHFLGSFLLLTPATHANIFKMYVLFLIAGYALLLLSNRSKELRLMLVIGSIWIVD